MNYLDGNEMLVGDIVIADDSHGVVVCVIESQQFTAEYPAAAWAYLEKGVLIVTENLGLIHYPVADEDIIFKERQQ